MILPGSKSVMADLHWLRQQGWESYIKRHLRYGGKVIGICGGLQMLGESIEDPHKVESGGRMHGLGLLPISTVLAPEKTLRQRSGLIHLLEQEAVIEGYEIHHGLTQVNAENTLSQSIRFSEQDCDGWLSEDGQIWGTYLHGLFDHVDAQALLLQWAGLDKTETVDLNVEREKNLDRLAGTLEQHMDLAQLQIAIERFYRQKSSLCV